MKGKEFLDSKWMLEAAEPGAEKKIENKYQQWVKRVSDTGILSRAKQLYQYFISPDIKGTQKLVVIAALLYIVSPLDIIPDVLPVIGWLDDLGVAGFALNYVFSQMDNLAALSVEKEALGKTHEESQSDVDDEIEGTSMPFDFSSVGSKLKESSFRSSDELKHRLDELADVARTLSVPEPEECIPDVVSRIDGTRMLRMAVVGRYSTGKSSLINALIGKPILPAYARPTTKAVTYLMTGSRQTVCQELPDGNLLVSYGGDLKGELEKASNARRLSVTFPEFPFDGLTIVDTPGLEDGNQEISKLTYDEIPRSDAFVVVLDAKYMQSIREFEFIAMLPEVTRKGKLFVVINKIDGVPTSQVDKLVSLCRQQLVTRGVTTDRIFPVCVKGGVGDEGFKAFQKELSQFLEGDVRLECTRRIEGALGEYAATLLTACEDSVRKIGKDEHARREEAQEAAARIADLESTYKSRKQDVGRSLGKYKAQLKLDFSEFVGELKASMRQQILQSAMEDLRNTDALQVGLKKQIVSWIDARFADVERKIDGEVSTARQNIQNALVVLNVPITFKLTDVSTVVPLIMPSIILGAYFFGGFMTFVWSCVASTIGRDFFESAIGGFIKNVGVNGQRNRLADEVARGIDACCDKMMPEFDKVFDALEKNVFDAFDSACRNARMPLEMASRDNGLTVERVEECRDRIRAITAG